MFAAYLCFYAISITVTAQPQGGIKELPIVEKPRTRAANEKVVIRTLPAQPTKGVLAVVLDPIVAGKITVKDAAGRIVLATLEADEKTGQAEFQLQRRKAYQIEASSPGYLPATRKSNVLGNTAVIRLQLTPQFATLRLPDLPMNAQVYLDDQLRLTVSQGKEALFRDLTPGEHSLIIKHALYNDYTDQLNLREAGATYTASVRLTKVAKLTIQALPNAAVMIDGEFQGRINANGQVQIDYQLAQAAEHTIAVELLGYQTWSSKELLTPGPRKLEIKLDPIVTSTGVTDGFANLAQWNYPATWKIVREKGTELDTSKLQVSGSGIGVLKEKTYRDFKVTFTVWLSDEKGASWVVRTDRGNYYLFHLSGPKAGELTPRRLYTYRMKDGQLSEVETPTPMTLDFKAKDSYYITVSVRGNQIEHVLQAISTAEESKAIYTDTHTDKDVFLYGSFGFTSFKGEIFLVDDLLLDPVKE